jgi:hypothetical protein
MPEWNSQQERHREPCSIIQVLADQTDNRRHRSEPIFHPRVCTEAQAAASQLSSSCPKTSNIGLKEGPSILRNTDTVLVTFIPDIEATDAVVRPDHVGVLFMIVESRELLETPAFTHSIGWFCR